MIKKTTLSSFIKYKLWFTKSNLSQLLVINEFEIFLPGQVADFPIKIVKLVSCSSLEDCVQLSLFSTGIDAAQEHGDLSPLLFRKQMVIFKIHS